MTDDSLLHNSCRVIDYDLDPLESIDESWCEWNRSTGPTALGALQRVGAVVAVAQLPDQHVVVVGDRPASPQGPRVGGAG